MMQGHHVSRYFINRLCCTSGMMANFIWFILLILLQPSQCQILLQANICEERGLREMELSETQSLRNIILQMKETFTQELTSLKKDNLHLKETMNVTTTNLQQTLLRQDRVISRQNETINKLMEKNKELTSNLESRDSVLRSNINMGLGEVISGQNATFRVLQKSLQKMQNVTVRLNKTVLQILEDKNELRSSMEDWTRQLQSNITDCQSRISQEAKAESDAFRQQEIIISNIVQNMTRLESKSDYQKAENEASCSNVEKRVEKTERDITEIQNSFQDAKKTDKLLNASIFYTDKKITSLTNESRLLERSIKKLDNNAQNITTAFENLRNTTNVMAVSIRQLDNSMMVVNRELTSFNATRDKVSSLERSMGRFQLTLQQINNTVYDLARKYGFTVRLGNSTVLSSRETIPFIDVLNNAGDVFNLQNYNFHAPVDGLFYFHLMVCSQRGKRVTAEIVSAQGRIGFVYAEDQNNFDCAGNGILTNLSSGDAVWARAVHDSYFDPNTFFTGMLIVHSL